MMLILLLLIIAILVTSLLLAFSMDNDNIDLPIPDIASGVFIITGYSSAIIIAIIGIIIELIK